MRQRACGSYGSQKRSAAAGSECRRRVAPEQLAFKICRLQREDPELYGKIKAFLSLKDFVNCKLTGISAIDHTTASYSLLYDVEKR